MAENYRSFAGEIRNLRKDNDFIYEVEVYLLNNIRNRNGWQYTDMAGNKNQFVGTPLLIAYVNNGATIGDGHNFKMEVDKDGNEAPSFTGATAERIIGAMSEKEEDMRIETMEDGTEWIVGKGFIWKWYAKEAVEKIENDTNAGRPMSISIETLVTKSHMDGDTEVEDEYTILGTTILGDGVLPAVADARIIALNEIASEFKELKLRAASYIVNESEKDEEETGVDEENDTIKPHTNSTEGEVSKLSNFSKKQLAELEPKFTGYKVLSAMQDDNGIHVCLMSVESGITAVYTMASADDDVVAEKIVKTNAQVVFKADEWEQTVDVDCVTDEFSAKIVKANNALASEKERADNAEKELADMKAFEAKRRISAAKEKATSTLSKFNANREQKVSTDILAKLNESIDNGEFSDCVDANGEWVGEAEVENRVLAACATTVMEQDAIEAKNRMSQYIWDSSSVKKTEGTGDVADLLSQFGIN